MLWRPRHVRIRLTLWYVAILAGVLLLYAGASSLFLYFNLRNEIDQNLYQDFETVENLIELTPDSTITLREHYHDEEEDLGTEAERMLEVWSTNGTLLYHSGRKRDFSLGPPPTVEEGRTGMNPRSVRLADGTRVRLLTGLYNIEGKWMILRLAHSEERLWNELREFIGVLALGLPVTLLLTALAGYSMARRALKPIDKMTRQAQEISAERLSERLPVENPADELGHLAQVFNAMLDRIEESFKQLRRFTADASHELRTPLTALRSVGEVGLQNTKNASQYREIIGSMLEEVDRMTHLVDSLLLLTRAGSGQVPLQREKLDLLDIARESAELLEVLAQEKDQHLEVRGELNVVVSADRTLLRQAVVNLIDNAIKYSPKGSSILVRVGEKHSGEAFIEVVDQGPGIPEEHQQKVFERFYRVDKARSRQLGGAGLGLAIVRWAVEAHGGRVELESKTGDGSVFRIVLPN